MGLHEKSLCRFSVSILILSTIAFLAMTVGVFSPAWVVVDRSGARISEGPWYTRACPLDGGDCIISTREMIYESYSDGKGDSALMDEHWFLVKIESTTAVALVCLSLASAIFTVVKRNTPSVLKILVAGGVCLLSSSILSLLAVLKVMSASSNVNISTPWSRDVTLAGSVAAFGASCLYVFAISQSCLRNNKLRRLKQQRSSVTANGQNSDPGNRPIQIVLMDSLQNSVLDGSFQNSFLDRLHNDTISSLRGQTSNDSDCGNDPPGKCPNQPPAYSEIYGGNATCAI